MKNSGIEWIGEIPEEWSIKRIKFYFDVICGATPESDNTEYWDGYIRWITPADMNEFGSINNGERTITNKGYRSCGTTIVPVNSIIVSCRAPIGKINYTTSELCTNQGCKSLVRGKLKNRYFYYFLIVAKEELVKLGRGTTFMELSTDSLKNFPLIIPNEKDQLQIADFLDDKVGQIEGILSDLNKQIDILNKYKKSLITETVTKGLDPNVKMKDSEIDWIGEIPEEWSVKPLKYLTKLIIDGTHNTPTYVDDGIPFLRVTDITSNDGIDKTIKFDSVAKIPKEEHQNLIKRCKPEVGDLLVSKNGTIGVPKIVDWNWEFSIFVSLCLIKTKDNLLVKWLYYYFKSELIDIEIAYGGKKNTIVNLHLEKIENFRIPLPPLAEQQQIANYLDKKCTEINSAISDKQKQIETMEKLKKSLIYEYVTGKKRVGGELKCQEISLESEKTFSSIL